MPKPKDWKLIAEKWKQRAKKLEMDLEAVRNNVPVMTADTLLTSHDAAKMIQVNPSSINKWIKEGRILAFTTPGGHRRLRAGDFVAFLDRHEMPVPVALAEVRR